MSEDHKTPGTAVALRERLITEAPVAIWDTADFEHMGRVAATMAESGLMSETFLKDGDNDASPKAVVARCLLVASIARECGANPLVFLQHCSVIGRKLHFEGKLVNSIIRLRTGVNLKFRFGVWNTDHIEFPPHLEDGAVDETFFHGVGDRLAVRCYDPNDTERYVDGSVGQWKTDRRGSPWSKASDWRRQLRYRSAPEWARAYEPGAVLGIYADVDDTDEIDNLTEVPRTSGLMGRLSGEQAGAGFDMSAVDGQTKAAPRTRRKKDAPTEAEVVRDAGEAFAAAAAAEEQNRAEAAQDVAFVDAALDGDTLPESVTGTDERPTSQEAPADGASAPSAEAEPDSPASATDASTGSAEEPSAPSQDEPRLRGNVPITEGHAEPGEVYLHETDTVWADGRWLTFKDGSRFSSVSAEGAAKMKLYAEHAPEPPEDVECDHEFTTGQGGEYACKHCGALPEEPIEEEVGGAVLPPELRAYADAVEAAQSWGDVKQAMADFFKTDFFKALSLEQQNEARRDTWLAVMDAKDEGRLKDVPDHAADVSAFRLWIEAQEDHEAIQGTWNILAGTEEFKQKPDATRDQAAAIVQARIAILKG